SFFQPFPSFMTTVIQHFGKVIQLIDGSSDYVIAEQSYYPVPQISLALSSFLFNVHPLPVLWMTAFIQGAVLSVSVFLISKKLFGRTIPSLVASFFSAWLLGGTPVQNNPYVVSNGTIEYAFFVVSLLVVTYLLIDGKSLLRKR